MSSRPAKVYIESESEKSSEYLFVAHLLRTECGWSETEIKDGLIRTGGKDKIGKLVPTLRANTEERGINLIIFDADGAYNNGGYGKRKAELEALKGKYDIEFELFLFPSNHEDGMVEDLLGQLVPEDKRCLLTCFERYQKCVGGRGFHVPDTKAKIYSYMDCAAVGEKDWRKNWCFDKSEYWDLNVPALDPLKEFLRKYAI